MINPEKEAAVRRFSAKHGLDVRADLVDAISRSPINFQDEGFKVGGTKSAVTIYKAVLYRQGVSPGVIAEGANTLRSTLSDAKFEPAEKGKKHSGQTSLELVSGLAKSVLKNEPQAKNMGVVTMQETLRPGVVQPLNRIRR